MTTKTYAQLGTFTSVGGAFLIAGWDPAGPGPLKTGTASVFRTYFQANLGTASLKDTGTSGNKVALTDGANMWSAVQTFTQTPVFTEQANTRTALGLGTSALKDTGASGANVPLMNGTNTWAGAQTFSGGLSGTLTGNVTGNVTGSSGSCTGNAATATTATTANGVANNSVGVASLTVGAPNWDSSGNVLLGGNLTIGGGRARVADDGTSVFYIFDTACFLSFNLANRSYNLVKDGVVVASW